MRYPVKAGFQMRGYYPESTPQSLIGNKTYKQIPNSLNGSSQTCKMRYSQIANSLQSSTVANSMLFTFKTIPTGNSKLLI
jgi:hypothetical protein